MSIPEFRQLLSDSLVYVLEPFANEESLNARMEESQETLDEGLRGLKLEVDMAEAALDRYRKRAIAATLIIVILTILSTFGIAYFGIIRKDDPKA